MPPSRLTRVSSMPSSRNHAGKGLGGEGLVELEHVDVLDREPGAASAPSGVAGDHGTDAHDLGARNRRPRSLGAAPAAAGLLRLAYSSVQTSTAEAPSVSGEEVPAVTEPAWSKAGCSAASACSEVSGRMQPSCYLMPCRAQRALDRHDLVLRSLPSRLAPPPPLAGGSLTAKRFLLGARDAADICARRSRRSDPSTCRPPENPWRGRDAGSD